MKFQENSSCGSKILLGDLLVVSLLFIINGSEMQLVIKTPLYKFTAYCSHLVEHCILSGYSSEDRFFDFTIHYSDAETKVGRTQFWIWHEKELQLFIQEIKKPLDRKVLLREKKLLNQELGNDKGCFDFLGERIWKILYQKQRIPTWKAMQLSQQEVSDFTEPSPTLA